LTKKKLFIWTCDYSENSGEGSLARLFIKNLNQNKKFKLNFNQKKIIKQKYISTFIGIVYCWKKFLNKENVCYLNYLPFWNFFIFILLPPKTILGPITGGAYYSKSNILSYFIRGLVFPIFYKISEFFLNLRDLNPIFSTNLLEKYLSRKTLKKSNLNYVVQNFFFKKNKRKKKKIDFLIYYRNHKNKKSLFPYKLIKNFIQFKLKIYVVGDKLNLPNIKNCGFLTKKKISNLQSLSKYTIASGENLYSFFVLECMSHYMKVIVEKNIKKKFHILNKNFIELNYNSLNSVKKLK
jgi:hypothetical protein